MNRIDILERKVEVLTKALLAEVDSTRGLILMNDLKEIEDHEDWLDLKDTEDCARPILK